MSDHDEIPRAAAPHVASLESQGWHVVVEPDSVGICRFFKNGKPRKTPVVLLRFIEWTEENECDAVTGEITFIKRRSARPYRLESVRFGQAKTFAILNSAVMAFLDEAREHTP